MLADTSLEWTCCQCGLPNFSSSIFSETVSASKNFYDVLSPNVATPNIHELPIFESLLSQTSLKDVKILNLPMRKVRKMEVYAYVKN